MAETKVVLCLPVGGGRAGRPRKHMPGHSGALSAQRFSLTCEWSSPRGEGGKPLWDPRRVKLRSQSDLLKLNPCGLEGFVRSLKGLFGGLKASPNGQSRAYSLPTRLSVQKRKLKEPRP